MYVWPHVHVYHINYKLYIYYIYDVTPQDSSSPLRPRGGAKGGILYIISYIIYYIYLKHTRLIFQNLSIQHFFTLFIHGVHVVPGTCILCRTF